jgi:hypothetical protein
MSGGKRSTEQIIGSLVDVKGHTFDMVYDLFFTTERVIAVSIRHPVDDTRPPSIWQYMFLGTGWSAGREKLKRDRKIKKKRRSLQDMTPDELLEAHSRNSAIAYIDISSVELKRRFLQWQLSFHVSASSDEEKVVRFSLSKKQVPEAERLLRKIPLAPDSAK